MMRSSVPQFINVEDKIAGPLSWRQLYWVIGMVIILLVLWKTLPLPVFAILGFLVFVGFMAMAFYKPWGQSLPKVAWFAIVYLFRPKTYTWKRTPRPQSTRKKSENLNTPIQTPDTPDEVSNKIRTYADLLDNPSEHISDTPLTTKPKRGILNIFSKKNKG